MKFKSKIPKDVDPIELADKMKKAVFKDAIKRLRQLANLAKSR